MNASQAVLQKTYWIRCDGGEGTGFTVEVDGRRYLVTARHVVDTIPDAAMVDVAYDGGWLQVPVRLVGHGAGETDVSVLAPQIPFGPVGPLTLSGTNFFVSEDVYFLGFPYGFATQVGAHVNNGFPLPLVKRGLLSGFGPGQQGFLFLDGHNNPGFSGGPVVRAPESGQQTVIGVISGYESERCKVEDEDGSETSYTYEANTGIVFAHRAGHALDIIARNPIGIPIP